VSGRIAAWVLLALAGLAVAVALSVAASNLSTQPIGLSGEPLRAGDRLAPAVRAPARPVAKPRRKAKPKPPVTPTATQPVPAPPGNTAVVPTPAPTTPAGARRESGDDHGDHHSSGDD
jgi:hypothetical protein